MSWKPFHIIKYFQHQNGFFGRRSPVLRLILILLLSASCGQTHLVKEVKKIDHYPSASGIEYYRDHFYVIGDDASTLLILDSNFIVTDSILLYNSKEKRLPKDTKPDLEAITIIGWKSKPQLLITGSGSLSPYRNIAWLIDPITKQKDSIRLDTFYQRLKYQGLEEINIEGSCTVPGTVLFSNRGHKGYRKNFLVFTREKFTNNQSQAPITLIQIGANTDTAVFNGISGLDYAPKSDRLVLTVSTENTRSVYEDGAIGKSYIWIVNSISSKRNWKSINPNQVIELDALDKRFQGQKIESVCIIKETRHFIHLALAADNDDGSSTLFKLIVEKK